MAPSASVLKKAREAAAKLKEKKRKMMLKEEEEDLGDMCGPMRPPPIQNKEDECVLDEVEAGPTMLPIRGSQSPQKKKKKKGRWGDSSEEEEEEEEEEEAKENEEAATKGNNYRKESYLEKMMNEQAEFANFTAQQMQEEEEYDAYDSENLGYGMTGGREIAMEGMRDIPGNFLIDKDASILRDLIKLANSLDSKGMIKEADYIDMIIKIAENQGDYFGKPAWFSSGIHNTVAEMSFEDAKSALKRYFIDTKNVVPWQDIALYIEPERFINQESGEVLKQNASGSPDDTITAVARLALTSSHLDAIVRGYLQEEMERREKDKAKREMKGSRFDESFPPWSGNDQRRLEILERDYEKLMLNEDGERLPVLKIDDLQDPSAPALDLGDGKNVMHMRSWEEEAIPDFDEARELESAGRQKPMNIWPDDDDDDDDDEFVF